MRITLDHLWGSLNINMLASHDQTDQLERDLRQAILTGVLAPASKLMSVRSLAAQYKLTYGRTLRTLKRLEKQGLLITRHGGGTFIADEISAPAPAVRRNEFNEDCAVIVVPPNYWANPESLWFVEFLRGFETLMKERGASMKLHGADAYLNRTEEFPAMIRTHVILALMNDTQQKEIRQKAGTQATLMLVAHDPRHADWALVMDVDGPAGIRQAADALLERGHEQLAFLTWSISPKQDDQRWWLERRQQAFELSMLNAGQKQVIIGAPFPESGYDPETSQKNIEQSIEQALKSPARPTALVCANDILAQHAINVCAKIGLRVPADLSIIGFDDEPWSVAQGLSTLHRPYRELGRMAGELAYLNQRYAQSRCRGALTIDPHLVLRNSVAPVN